MNHPGELVAKWQSTSVLELWHSQVIRHHQEIYKGIGLAKFPQDLWSYEKLLDLSAPEVILEIGINEGGFTRWLYDRLLTAQIHDQQRKPRTIIGIDICTKKAKLNLSSLLNTPHDGIKAVLIECDLLDESSLQKAKSKIIEIVNGRPLLIIEDSGHTYATTKAALDCFAELLKPSEWFIVEDTCVDIEELREIHEWPRGALAATDDFLRNNSDFERTTFNHAYEITCHPFGFIQKKLITAGT
jgi:cephalosporin hydroxylase